MNCFSGGGVGFGPYSEVIVMAIEIETKRLIVTINRMHNHNC